MLKATTDMAVSGFGWKFVGACQTGRNSLRNFEEPNRHVLLGSGRV